MPMDGRVE